ncbi:MAG: hypothetical protein OEY56_12535 [Cyclobacteriaceae bacterium]|nr:hypothetical protein [Cyclobacteriaceae bacterium]
MDPGVSRQVMFLKNIQEIIPANHSLVNELATLLDISNDSAYRRIRGETSLTFDEISQLCAHFNLSFDAFNAIDGDHMVSFRYHSLEESQQSFSNYFLSLSEEIERVKMATAADKHILYAGQGIPLFHYLKFPVLTAFKMFYWMKSIMTVDELQSDMFYPDKIDQSLIGIGKSIYNSYISIPSTEIWTDTTFLGSLHQIRFYWDSGIFPSADSALEVCQELRLLLEHVQKMAEISKKRDDFLQTRINGEELNLYFSEIEFEQNCIIVNVGDLRRVYLGQFNFGFIATENSQYYLETQNWLRNIIRKSNLISGASDTVRYQFFRRCFRNLEALESRIKNE